MSRLATLSRKGRSPLARIMVPLVLALVVLGPRLGHTQDFDNIVFSGPAAPCPCGIANLESTFSFDATVVADYEVVIDLNDDGIFDAFDGTDRLIEGTTIVGSNVIPWDGLDNNGDPAPANASIEAEIYVTPDSEFIELCVADGSGDPDGDGLLTSVECGAGNRATDPDNLDTDNDGLPDGLAGGIGEDINLNGTLDPGETDPSKQDTDDDDLSDGVELGVDTSGELIANATGTDPLNEDSDDDGLTDGTEDKNKNGILDAGETDPRRRDTDGDRLLDGEEDQNGNGIVDSNETDPRNRDTDGGGEEDGTERLETGHNPLDPQDDRPPTAVLRGGRCNIARGSAGADLALMLVLGGWLVSPWRRRKRRPHHRRSPRRVRRALYIVFFVGMACTFGSRPAHAQIEFSVNNFRPAASPLNFYVTEGGLTLPHLMGSAQIFFHYAKNPLQMSDSASGDTLKSVISSRINMDLLLAMGFFDFVELRASYPSGD